MLNSRNVVKCEWGLSYCVVSLTANSSSTNTKQLTYLYFPLSCLKAWQYLTLLSSVCTHLAPSVSAMHISLWGSTLSWEGTPWRDDPSLTSVKYQFDISREGPFKCIRFQLASSPCTNAQSNTPYTLLAASTALLNTVISKLLTVIDCHR